MNGFLILDKPQGLTSFAAVSLVRRLTGIKKVGHTGTLDPMATGVLPLALGAATRFIELLPRSDKAYRAKILLGLTTDTLDITGKVLSRGKPDVTLSDFEKALGQFTGPIKQIPPMYSALSKDGVRLYDLARQGLEIEREPRDVIIYSAEIVEADESAGEFTVDITCSAGTYIRSLADDIGRLLKCGAVLSELRRTSANGFSETECLTPEDLEKKLNNEGSTSVLVPLDRALGAYGEIRVTVPQAVRFKNGGSLALERLKAPLETGYFRVYSPENEFLGLGEIKPLEDQLKVKRVFVSG